MKLTNLNKKGQAIIPIIIIFFFALLVLSVILSPMIYFIGIGVNATNGTVHGDLAGASMNLYPLFMIGIIIIGFAYRVSRGG